MGDGAEEGTELGPVNNRPQFQRVAELVDDAVRSGAHLLLFAGLVDELAMTDGELEGLVIEAEELAVDAIAETVRDNGPQPAASAASRSFT